MKNTIVLALALAASAFCAQVSTPFAPIPQQTIWIGCGPNAGTTLVSYYLPGQSMGIPSNNPLYNVALQMTTQAISTNRKVSFVYEPGGSTAGIGYYFNYHYQTTGTCYQGQFIPVYSVSVQ